MTSILDTIKLNFSFFTLSTVCFVLILQSLFHMLRENFLFLFCSPSNDGVISSW